MHEHVVDSIRAGYPCSTSWRSVHETIRGRPLTGVSSFQKAYDECANAVERDFLFVVYFDEAGYVIGVEGGQYDS